MPQARLQADAIGLPTNRRQIEQKIAALIDLLDSIDADPDLEPDADLEDTADDEPSLGWRGPSGYLGESTDQAAPDFYGNADAGQDLEDEHDGAEPEIEEGSLGWPEVASQDRDGWHGGCHSDAELDQADAEPSLGWTDNPKQCIRRGNRRHADASRLRCRLSRLRTV